MKRTGDLISEPPRISLIEEGIEIHYQLAQGAVASDEGYRAAVQQIDNAARRTDSPLSSEGRKAMLERLDHYHRHYKVHSPTD